MKMQEFVFPLFFFFFFFEKKMKRNEKERKFKIPAPVALKFGVSYPIFI